MTSRSRFTTRLSLMSKTSVRKVCICDNHLDGEQNYMLTNYSKSC